MHGSGDFSFYFKGVERFFPITRRPRAVGPGAVDFQVARGHIPRKGPEMSRDRAAFDAAIPFFAKMWGKIWYTHPQRGAGFFRTSLGGGCAILAVGKIFIFIQAPTQIWIHRRPQMFRTSG